MVQCRTERSSVITGDLKTSNKPKKCQKRKKILVDLAFNPCPADFGYLNPSQVTYFLEKKKFSLFFIPKLQINISKMNLF